jgi:hypothetical protein
MLSRYNGQQNAKRSMMMMMWEYTATVIQAYCSLDTFSNTV